VGAEQGVRLQGELALDNRVPGSTMDKITPVRIEVAKSGDLAYEFSNSDLSYQLKSGQKVNTKTSTLRVWRKENDVWKVAAHFARPHADQPGVANRTTSPAAK
jgi:ketosteroid isomerase-like protein